MNFTVSMSKKSGAKCEYPAGITMTVADCREQAEFRVIAEGNKEPVDHDYCRYHVRDVVGTLMGRMDGSIR